MENQQTFTNKWNHMCVCITMSPIMIRCSRDGNNFTLCLHHGHLGVILVYNLKF